jgi:hypothetical protein
VVRVEPASEDLLRFPAARMLRDHHPWYEGKQFL